MKSKAIIFLLLISLACSPANFAAALQTDRASASVSSSPLPRPDAPSKITLAARAADLAPESPVMRVCTNVPEGRLRVREDAGVDHAVVSLLPEGAPVSVITRKPVEGGTIWAHIRFPQGWVNFNYLCKE
ncbi:MAG: SH3 domain-containing protein [Anaerolineales bacterium]|nr:SH3 domain-containing protein [Anaerolineales bacterium]